MALWHCRSQSLQSHPECARLQRHPPQVRTQAWLPAYTLDAGALALGVVFSNRYLSALVSSIVFAAVFGGLVYFGYGSVSMSLC